MTVEEYLADMKARGYVELEEFEGLRAGVRVRGRGEQYAEAFRDGTGNVLHVLRRDPSSWARTYGHPDVELVVGNDDPERAPRFVADYHVEIVEVRDGLGYRIDAHL